MDCKNRLIIAAAGAGKTTTIIKEALKIKDSNILITTFTESNRDEIIKKFYEENRCIPSNVTIMTWFSFLIRHGAKPYQKNTIEIDIKGLELVNSQSAFRYFNDRLKINIYWKEDENIIKHYFNNNNQIYSDKLAKFVVRCNKDHDGYVIKRLEKNFNYIFIDEIQDMAGNDLEIIKLLLYSKIQLCLVGDPRQTTYLTHNERKYEKYSYGKIKEFIENECRKKICICDETTLNYTYRCNQIIIDEASELFPQYKIPVSNNLEKTGHDGIFWVKPMDIADYMKKYEPTIITYTKLTSIFYRDKEKRFTFGLSKGLTFDRVIIYPTDDQYKWLKNHNAKLKDETRCKLYVGMTRAKYSVAFVDKK